MKNIIGQILGYLIVGVVAYLIAFGTVAGIEWSLNPAAWPEHARAFCTFLFWGLVIGFAVYRGKP